LLEDGTVACWGHNISGQLGDNSTTDRLAPTAIPNLANVSAIAAGRAHTCAVSFGVVQCWGANEAGQLGTNTTTNELAPGPFVFTDEPWQDGPVGPGNTEILHNVTEIRLGYAHSCALTSYGPMACWGDNAFGQLGTNSTTDRDQAHTVPNLYLAAIGTGSRHTCALPPGGYLYCWGANGSGQVGDNSTTNRLTPRAVSSSSRFVTIAPGWAHTCAALAVGDTQCWGSNAYGQLGDGSTTNRSVPTNVAPL
jgi:alpha-tubulin suppressor-like RCC1 family protein